MLTPCLRQYISYLEHFNSRNFCAMEAEKCNTPCRTPEMGEAL